MRPCQHREGVAGALVVSSSRCDRVLELLGASVDEEFVAFVLPFPREERPLVARVFWVGGGNGHLGSFVDEALRLRVVDRGDSPGDRAGEDFFQSILHRSLLPWGVGDGIGESVRLGGVAPKDEPVFVGDINRPQCALGVYLGFLYDPATSSAERQRDWQTQLFRVGHKYLQAPITTRTVMIAISSGLMTG